MKRIDKRIGKTDCTIFTANPSEGILGAKMQDPTTVDKFTYDWHTDRGKTIVCVLNANFFNNDRTVVGGVYTDNGFIRNPFSTHKDFTTMVYQNGIISLDKENNIDRLKASYPSAWFMLQLGPVLVKDGAIFKDTSNFGHAKSKNPRSFIGQKANGDIVMFATDGRFDEGFTIKELQQIALDLECVNAINNDGGESVEMAILGDMINENKRAVPVTIMFLAQNFTLDIEKPDLKKKIMLDAGHGMSTRGKRSPNGIREAQQNYPIMFILYELLKDKYDVRMTNVNMANDPTITYRTDLANNWKADLFFSIHKDALKGTWDSSLTGISTLVYSNKSSSNPFAKAIHENLIKKTGMKDRGIRYRPDLGVLRLTTMPSILCELGFMDGTNDYKQMYDYSWWLKYATAIADGIKESLR